jgi:hypothetical protein
VSELRVPYRGYESAVKETVERFHKMTKEMVEELRAQGFSVLWFDDEIIIDMPDSQLERAQEIVARHTEGLDGGVVGESVVQVLPSRLVED